MIAGSYIEYGITAHLGVIFGYCRLITGLSLYLCNPVELLMLPVVLSRIDTYVSERAHNVIHHLVARTT